MSRIGRAVTSKLSTQRFRLLGLSVRKRAVVPVVFCVVVLCSVLLFSANSSLQDPTNSSGGLLSYIFRRENATHLCETTVTPLFGAPSKRPPIRVRRSAARQQLLAEAAANRTELYIPLEPPQTPESPLPRSFDWRAYLQYNPELAAAGIRTRRQAQQHYRRHGRQEGRLCRRQRVLMRYTAGTGLTNQQYCHVAAFALAAATGAELVLPPAAKRDSFGLYFSTKQEENKVSWAPAALDHILDVKRMKQLWHDKGIILHETPPLVPFPDLVTPEAAYQLYDPPGIDPRLITRVSGVYLAKMDLDELVELVRDAVVSHAASLLRDQPDADIPVIVVDFPVPLFMLRSLSAPELVADVAANLPFAPEVQALADRVTRGIAQKGAPAFNSLHLRMEADAKDWMDIIGGSRVLENEYLRAMRANKFSAHMPVYVASGLLTYGADEALRNVTTMLQEAGLCSTVYHKEQFIDAETMAGLDSEQTALVDFLVLAGGQRFVGFGSSTFSFYLQYYRKLMGVELSTNMMIDILDKVDGNLDGGGRLFAAEA